MPMQMFMDRKLFKAFSPILYLARNAGVCPAKFAFQSRYILKNSLPWLLYSCLVGVLSCFSLSYGFAGQFNERYLHMKKILTTFRSILIMMIITFRIMTFPFTMDAFKKILNDFQEIDLLLPAIQTKSSTRNKGITGIIITTLVYLTPCMLSIIDAVIKEATIKTYMVLLSKDHTQYCLIILQMLHSYFVYFVLLQMKSFNHLLREYIFYSSKHRKTQYVKMRIQYWLDKHNEDMLNDKLYKLMTARSKVYEEVLRINTFFGFTMMTLLMSIMCELMLTPHGLYLRLRQSKDTFATVKQSAWLMIHVLRLILIVEFCERCIIQDRISMYYIRKYLSNSGATKSKRQFEMLASQISVCPIKFSLMNIISLERRLLAPMTEILTTFMVIVFQYFT